MMSQFSAATKIAEYSICVEIVSSRANYYGPVDPIYGWRVLCEMFERIWIKFEEERKKKKKKGVS